MYRIKQLVIRVISFLHFCGIVVLDVSIANFRVAMDVIVPRLLARPAFIKLPIDCQTDTQITWLANVISLTPGTLVIDVSSDKRWLYMHVMYLDNKQALVETIKQRYEQHIMRFLL